ncbi:hypothetical protein [Arthrobacter sp. CJ23]|uniref:hypothetical protein n=1 Tax=Arthrobacter sp. CJ23 TaxID=2972479 RepID=UPI00215D0C27|nr:hypothetical protein [Arthrobacter sp. CJ23]UVJ39443.1 hypothetical protein NVV90_19970 [Arthrobacter sp. CJ23]
MAEVTPIGSGGAPHPMAPPPDGTLQIRGGVGGIAFQFEELLAGAAALDELHGQLQDIEREAEAVRQALFPYQADSYASGSNAVNAVGEGGREVGRVRDQLYRISREVRASHREYEFTEDLNALQLRAGLRNPALESGLRPDNFGKFSRRDVADSLVAQAPFIIGTLLGLPAAALGFATTIAGPMDVRATLKAITGMPGFGFLKPRPVTVEKSASGVETVDATMAAQLERLDTFGNNNTRGEIEIQEFNQDGIKRWVVLIPGTQHEDEIGGSNPLDEAGIVDGLGYDSAETNAAILEALHAAGAKAGEQVVAIGHSQGGIHAMNLSQDKAFLAEFDLKYVLTAGSPVGGIEAEPGISSLHLEHEQDWVPGADGLPNADTKERVTVTLTNDVATPEGEDPGLGPGHKLQNYADGARLVSASSDPSLMASTAAFAGVAGAGGVATVTRFKLTREPAQAQAAAPARSPLPETRSGAGPR